MSYQGRVKGLISTYPRVVSTFRVFEKALISGSSMCESSFLSHDLPGILDRFWKNEE